MAYEFYVSTEGTKQDKFEGESIREAHKNKIAGLKFAYEKPLQMMNDTRTKDCPDSILLG
jgi:hypothetical protein